MALTEREVSRFEELASDLVSGYQDALARIEVLEDEVKEHEKTIEDLNGELADMQKEIDRG